MSAADAAARIDASVGPTHGVQATANARPAITGPPAPAREISASGRHSRLSFGTNGVSRKKMLIERITMAAARSSVCLESRRVEPRQVAIMPSAMNMIVNDRQKIAAGHRIADSLCSPVRMSAMLTPDTADREQGTSGRTHGDTNEMKPTANAAMTVVSAWEAASVVIGAARAGQAP